ncbi:MAG TPA: hypothetical protein VJ972_11710 [Anaerolineales bacterium]|nr:hypothetical protein [Anaerolineales bacterium]
MLVIMSVHMSLNKITLRIKDQIPTLNMIVPVYAVISFVVYGWTLYWFVYEIPGLLNYLLLSEILVMYLYTLTVNLLESLIILFLSLALCVLLPKKWFYKGFVFRGTLLSLFVTVYFFGLILRRSQIMVFSTNMVNWFPVFLLIAFLMIGLLEKIPFLKKMVESFADRMTVFLYINIPVSVLAVITVLIRSVL